MKSTECTGKITPLLQLFHLGRLPRTRLGLFSRHVGAQQYIPIRAEMSFEQRRSSIDSQERLGKVGLDTIRLMVNIVVIRIVVKEQLTRIPPDLVSTMIIHRLGRRNGEKQGSLTDRQSNQLFRQYSSNRVHDQPFNRVIIQRAKSIWDVESMVDRVEMTVEESISVAQPVQGILPSVDHKAAGQRHAHPFIHPHNSQGEPHLNQWYSPPVHPSHQSLSIVPQDMFARL